MTSVAKRVSSKIGPFLRHSKFLKFDILYKIYFTLVVPHLDYCITGTIWGNSSSSHTDILQNFQNRLARIITKNYNYQIRGLDIVKQLGWMNVKERYQYFVATFMFKYNHGVLPPNLKALLLEGMTRIIFQYVLPPLVIYYYLNHVLSFWLHTPVSDWLETLPHRISGLTV